MLNADGGGIHIKKLPNDALVAHELSVEAWVGDGHTMVDGILMVEIGDVVETIEAIAVCMLATHVIFMIKCVSAVSMEN